MTRSEDDNGEDRARSTATSKREKMVAQYAAKRAALKAKADDMTARAGGALRRAPQARQAAAQFVARRASTIAASCRAVRSGYYRKLKMSRIALRDLANFGPDPGHDQGELVRRDRIDGDQRSDWRSAGAHPQRPDARQGEDRDARLRSCARACSTCCRPKAIIRGYAEVELKDGRSEFEIELKYHDGEPVIRELERVSTPGRRVYVAVQGSEAASPAASASRSCRRRRASCRMPTPATRTSAAKFSAGCSRGGSENCMSRIGKKAGSAARRASPPQSTAQTVKVKGPKGELTLDAGRRSRR